MKYTPSTPVADIGLASPAVRALHHAGYRTLEHVAKATPAELASLHGFGPNAQKKLSEAVAQAGLGDVGAR